MTHKSRGRKLSRQTFLQCMETMEARRMLSAVTWTGATSNAWETASNWSDSAVPGIGDDVTIPTGSTVVISSNAAANSITAASGSSFDLDSNSLTLGSDASTIAGSFTITATLYVGTGAVILSGQTSWTGDNINLAGDNVTQGNTLTNTGTLTITSPGLLQSSNGNGANLGGELDNQGTIIQPSGGYAVADSVVILNDAIYDFTGDATLSRYNDNSEITNTASGTIEKTGGTGTSTVALQSNNQGGKIEADTGTLSLANNGVSTGGTYNAAVNAAIDINGGQQPTWSGVYTGSGAGAINLDAGVIFIGTGGATFNFPAGLFNWSGGNINLAGSGVIQGNTLTNTGTITISTPGLLQSSDGNGSNRGGTFDNKGIIDQPTNTLSVADSVSLLNESTYDFTGDASLNIYNFNSNIVSTASGLIEKTGGVGTSNIQLPLDNEGGTIQAGTGTINLDNNGINTGGTYNAATGAKIDLTGGQFPTLGGTYTGSGGGTLALDAGEIDIASGGATFNFPTGFFVWSGGSINMAGSNVTAGNTLTNIGVITITSGGVLRSANGNGAGRGGELDNVGTILQPSGTYAVADNVVLKNENIYNFTGDSSLDIYNDSSNMVNTASGVIEKTAGTATTTIQLTLNNQGGSIEAETGTLSLGNNGVSTGGNYVAAANAVIDVTGNQAPTWSGTYTGSGGGTLLLDSNELDIGSGGATFNFPAGYFVWSGGNINLAGGNVLTGNTLTNANVITITSAGVLRSANGNGANLGGELDNLGTILQPSGTYSVADSVILKNENIYDFDGDSSLYIYNASSNLVNTASGVIEKTAGTATSTIQLTLNNQGGRIEADTGTLTLGNNGVSTGGNYVAATNAVIDVTGNQTPTWSGAYTGSGGGTLLLDSNELDIGPGGATFNFPAGYFVWSGGNINLAGGNVTTGNKLTNTGVITITSGGILRSANGNGANLGGELDNKGTIDQPANQYSVADSVSILNEGIYDFTGDASLGIYNDNSNIVNVTSGLIEKTVGTGNTTISLPVDNEGGTISANTGAITLNSSSTTGTGGIFNASAGATIDLTGNQSPTWTGSYTGSGAGTVRIPASGIFNIGAGGVTFNFPGNLFQWTGGYINSQLGNLTNLGTINIGGSGDHLFYNDGVLDNKGTIIQGANANLALHSDNQLPTTLLNEAGATYLFEGDGGIDNLAGGQTAVDNEGTMKKVGGTGTTTLYIPGTFTNNGTLDVESGTIAMEANTVSSRATGSLIIAAGATLDLTGGETVAYSGSFSSASPGTIALSSGTLAVATGGATFNFVGNLFQWTGGTIDLEGNNLTNTAVMTLNALTYDIEGDASYDFTKGGQLVNDGTIIQQQGTLNLDDSVELNNASTGVYQLDGDGSISTGNTSYYYYYYTTGAPTIVNAGTLEKTAGTGTSTIAEPLTNTGTVAASSGTLSLTSLSQLSSNALSGGTWKVSNGATLALPTGITSSAGTFIIDGASSQITGISSLSSNSGAFSLLGGANFTTAGNFSNSGTLTLGPASTFTVTGAFTQTSTGTLDIQLAGSPTSGQFGLLVSTNPATIGGTIQSEVLDGYYPLVNDNFVIATFPNATGSFATQNLSSNGTYTIVSSIGPINIILGATATSSDLGVKSIDGITPTSPAVGQSITVNYTVENFGLYTPVNAWNDSIFLSPDATLDSSAILIGRVAHSSGLAAGATYSGSLTAAVPGVLPGNYYIIVEADSGAIVGDKNRSNNILVSSPTAVTLPTLTIGGAAATGSIAAGQSAFYEINIPAGSNTQITLTSATPGAAVLLDQYLTIPTIDTYAQKAFSTSASQQTVTLSSAGGGTYYVLVYGQSAQTSNYTLAATSVPFAVNTVVPTSLANAGKTTLTITGNDFSPTSTANLVVGSTTLPATAVQFVDSNTLYATFDLTSAAIGNYDVQITDSGASVSLPAAVRVAAGTPGAVQVTISMPSLARVDRDFTALVTYTNTGQTDVIAPIIQLYSPTGTLMTLDLNSQPSATTIQFLGVGKQGPAGILEPGESETVQVLLLQNDGTAELNSSDIDSTNTGAMSWAYAQDSLNMTYESDTNLPAVLNQIETNTGSTWGDYDAMLAANATLMPAGYGDPSDIDNDLRLEYQRVAAALTPSISGSVTSTNSELVLRGQKIEADNSIDNTTYSGYILNDGSFAFPEVTAGMYAFSLTGAAVGSTNPSPVAVTTLPLTGVVINAVPEIAVTGTAFDSTGAPVPNVDIYIYSGTIFVDSGHTDNSGQYQITNLAPGTYDFVFTSDTAGQGEVDNITVNQPTNTVNLNFGAQANLNGTAVLSDGTPATNLYVFAQLQNSATPMSLFSSFNAGGSFNITGMPAGTYNLIFATGTNEATLDGLVITAGATLNLGTVHFSTGTGTPSSSATFISALTTDAGTNDDAQYPPGSTTPVVEAYNPAVLYADYYLAHTWIPAAAAKWGTADQAVWQAYLDATSLNPPTKETFVDGSDIVEGSIVAPGFRQVDDSDTQQNSQVSLIESAVVQGIQKMFASGTLSCQDILDVGGTYVYDINSTTFPGLITKSGENLLNITTDYSSIWNIPGNLAGGIGAARSYVPGTGDGQQYDDNRHWDGDVNVTIANNGQVNITFLVNMIVNDTVDFLPGNLGAGIEQSVTVPMSFLESVGESFDVPFQVKYIDERFTPRTFAIPVNPPVCPDPTRPPPPTTPQQQQQTQPVKSHDPNDLIGPGGYISLDESLPYTIDFENESTASAPAQVVTVTQQLDSNLDWSTFQLGDIHFGNYNVDVPSGLMSYTTQVDETSDLGVYVDVTASFDSQTGVASWTFTSIDPVTMDVPSNPLEGFLPADVTSPEGEGFVSYSVKPKSTLTSGSTVSAEATVVFDTNAPINTAQITATVDLSPPTSTVLPLAAYQVSPNFTVAWTGSDTGGSGVADYDIYVSTDGGSFTPWLTDITATSATYNGAVGHTYAFYSIAHDSAGNTQATPAAAEAQTDIVSPSRTISFSGKTKATYTDSAGHVVTISITGPGTGTIGFLANNPADPVEIIFNGTSAKSSVTIKVAGNAATNITDIQINGSLGKFTATTANFTGIMTVTGTLGAFTIHNVIGSVSSITISGTSVATIYKFGSIQDLALNSASPIKQFAATSWTSTGSFTDSLSAPSLASLKVTGNFDANVSLSAGGASLGTFSAGAITGGTWSIAGSAKSIAAGSISNNIITAAAIATMKVSGNLTNDNITLTAAPSTAADLGSFTIGGAVTNSQVRATGNIGKASVGSMSNSLFFAGVNISVTAQPAASSDFTQQSTILSFVAKGTAAFSNSQIAAATVDVVQLHNVTTNNNGTPFGVAADALKSFALYQSGAKPLVWTSKQSPSVLANLPGNLHVAVF